MVDIMATGVGDSFDEVLLQGIEIEVGETLEVVARAVTLGVELNRQGDYDAASHALKATAKKIRAYAGKDPELRQIVDGLMAESEMFGRVMQERSRKEHFAMSSHAMQSRDAVGKARRVRG
jgi:hypothetical protein